MLGQERPRISPGRAQLHENDPLGKGVDRLSVSDSGSRPTITAEHAFLQPNTSTERSRKTKKPLWPILGFPGMYWRRSFSLYSSRFTWSSSKPNSLMIDGAGFPLRALSAGA